MSRGESKAVAEIQTYHHPTRDRTVIRIEFANKELAEVAGRYGRVVLDRLADAAVEQILASAAVQARIAHLRAELPLRIEQAVTEAIAKAILRSRDP